LFSGILRIDIYGDDLSRVKPIEKQPLNGVTGNYWIPRSNPFVGVPDSLEEFWAIGLRNPFRFSFVPNSDALVVGEVGQSYYEEINILRAGANCGWSYKEGMLPSRLSRHRGRRPSGFIGVETAPVFSFRNSLKRGCVIGG
jgi:glucose/arabinose dehydrogenase